LETYATFAGWKPTLRSQVENLRYEKRSRRLVTCGEPKPGVLHVQVANLHLLGRLPACATVAG